MVVSVGLAVLLTWLAVSLGGALTDPALGSSVSARFAEWTRSHGGSGIVNLDREPVVQPPSAEGRRPPAPGAIRVPVALHPTAPAAAAEVPPHLPAPAPIVPLASPAIPGEGEWSPVGRLVGGIPAVYETTLRPDAVHTSYVVGVAWMDTNLLKATLYSGSEIPGGGPFTHTAPIQPSAATSLVAAFNAGFLMSNANGGYYTDGRTVLPLRTGAASFVIYTNGTSTVGVWGRDVTMTPQVVSVRQNLDLVVDGGQPVPGLNAADTTRWGSTLGDQVYVWRSGLGVTANGALVYVGGPGPQHHRPRRSPGPGRERSGPWSSTSTPTGSTSAPTSRPPPTGPATAANGTDLLPTMVGTPARYFESWWARDFITMSSTVGSRTTGVSTWLV